MYLRGFILIQALHQLHGPLIDIPSAVLTDPKPESL